MGFYENISNSFISNFWNCNEDPRTVKWLLVSNPFYPVALGLAYVYIVKVWGPNFMKNKAPYEIKNIIMAYNIFQVIFNGWMVFEFVSSGLFTKAWNYRCQPIDYTNNSKAIRIANTFWWFYISKYIDYFDTIFFMLRKKYSQITELHLIHHSTVPLSIWFLLKYSPGGHATLPVGINAFIHTVMYTYYFLASLGPKIQKYLWWKKYITTLQMIQFVVAILHALQIFFRDCDYPRLPIIIVIMNGMVFLILFSKFYKESYIRKKTGECIQYNAKDEQFTEKVLENKLKSG